LRENSSEVLVLLQEAERELGADAERGTGPEPHAAAVPRRLLPVLRRGPLQRSPVPPVPPDQNHRAARGPEGGAEEPQSREVEHVTRRTCDQ